MDQCFTILVWYLAELDWRKMRGTTSNTDHFSNRISDAGGVSNNFLDQVLAREGFTISQGQVVQLLLCSLKKKAMCIGRRDLPQALLHPLVSMVRLILIGKDI